MQRLGQVVHRSPLLSSSCRKYNGIPSVAGLVNGDRTAARYGRRLFSEWPLSRVRKEFVDYFIDKHKHLNVKSSPVAPLNDPTLLFTNAGMNQFKPIFLGTVNPESPLYGLKRAVNSQKCIRAGGKHNDLDDVGKDTYHHTFFEMLGTWSFGDYFKKEAIDWAFDILVNVYKLPKERLYASYFAGDAALGLPPDEEARSYWLKHLPAERILPFDKKANFWEMGETGPCGPCSEIHFDRIGNRDASKLVNMDDPDVIEIWNLVFIQFNRELNGSLSNLPDKHIDTGMGLERLTSILQDKRSNYDIDAFQRIFKEIERVTKCPPHTGKLGVHDIGGRDTAMRIVADHIRTLSFAIADGAYPSNEGRGYVLRRILRRAVRYGVQTLGADAGFFHKLVPVVVEIFGPDYPELVEREKFISSILHDEEMAFISLLKRGEVHLAQITSGSESSKVISGETAFFLYDSLGFPLDLTKIIAAERGFSVDSESFARCMEDQKSRSRADTRAKRVAGRSVLSLDAALIAELGHRGVPLTNDRFKYSADIRSTGLEAVLTTGGLQKDLNFESISANQDQIYGIVLTDTPFYSESGGQVADSGTLTITNEQGQSLDLQVIDVQLYGGYVLHNCIYAPSEGANNALHNQKLTSNWNIKNEVIAKIDLEKRKKIAPNHTSTHILNYAIRKVLGKDNDQRGSLVASDKLRFDFSCQSAPKLADLEAIQSIVNEVIKAGHGVYTGLLPLQEASKIPGLRAIFGESYPDPVRVVSVGRSIEYLQALASGAAASDSSGGLMEGSVEFCGGTHVNNTTDLGSFVITEEGSISQGVRRITAVTGELAADIRLVSDSLHKNYDGLNSRLQSLTAMASKGSTSPEQLIESIEKLAEEITLFRNEVDSTTWSYIDKTKMRHSLESLSKSLTQLRSKLLASKAEGSTKDIINMAKLQVERGMQFLAVEIPGIGSDSKLQKKAIDDIRKASGDSLCLFCIFPDPVDDKFSIITVVPEKKSFKTNTAVVSDFSAVSWLNQTLQHVGGRGGGKANTAQGSVPDRTKVALALEKAAECFTL